MSQGIKTFDGDRHDGVMSLMYEFKNRGYDNEFDNSLILRALWERTERIRTRADGCIDVYITTDAKPDPKHGYTLVITLHSSKKEGVTETITLFEKNDSLKILTDVIVEKIPASKSDLSSAGKSLEWSKAREVLAANPRYGSAVIAAFDAVAKVIQPSDKMVPKHIRLTPILAGTHVAFIIAGKNVLSLSLDFSYAALAA